MKKTTLALFTILIFNFVQSQIVTIPDPVFKNYLLSNHDTNEDGEIQESEAAATTGSIYLFGNTEVTSFTGIEAFINITEVNCVGCIGLTETLDLTNNTLLEEINLYRTNLTNLTVANLTNLTTLKCGGNYSINGLDISGCTALTELNVIRNNLTTLNTTTNTALRELFCGENTLTGLDLTNNTALTKLSCGRNNLTSLDLTNNIALTSLNCSATPLTSLDLTTNTQLKSIILVGNNLTSINLSNKNKLEYLDLHENKLTALDLSNKPNLITLNISLNEISSINTSENTLLEKFTSTQNTFTELDFSNNPNLTSITATSNNDLTFINLKNNNNTALNKLSTYNSDNLTCILVDDQPYAERTFKNINDNANFVETETECNNTLSKDAFSLNTLNIFPNPTSGILNISVPVKKATLFNTQGQILIESSKQTINLETLNNGLYLIQIEGYNNTITSKKILKI